MTTKNPGKRTIFKPRVIVFIAALVALVAFAGTIAPKPFGMTFDGERGEVLVISTPGLASSKFQEHPIPGSDGKIHIYKIPSGYEAFVPVRFVWLILIAALTSVVGLILIARKISTKKEILSATH
jgi:hypothetical protein